MRKSDRFIPMYFVLFFCFLFVVDGTMVYLAVSSHRGVVDENAYETGLQYNQVLKNAEAQEKSGWSSKIALQNDGKITVHLSDAKGVALTDVAVTGRVVRPTQDGYDFDLAFDGQKSETGLYIAEADFPLSGSWEILIRAEKDGTVYKESKKIFMRRK